MTRAKIYRRRLLMRDGEIIGWLVKRDGKWYAYVMTRLEFQVAFWIGEGRSPAEAADAACLLAEAQDVC